MSKLAKALYDNTAECPDELAFRKGDILTVIDQNIAGSSGWWICSLYGRHGLAPGNRLQLLPHTAVSAGSLNHVTEKSKLADSTIQNIYQTPSMPRPAPSPAYERMDMIYKVPSTPLLASKSPLPLKRSTDGPDGNKPSFFSTMPGPKGEVYDVPIQARRASLLTECTIPKPMPRKYSLIPDLELEKRFNSPESLRCSSPADSYVYAVPPPLPQDPNYDIPVPSATEVQKKTIGGYSTLPNPHKPEWIYDVPVCLEKQSPPQGTLLTCALPFQKYSPTPLIYDVPKPIPVEIQSPPKELPRIAFYNKPPNHKPTEKSVYSVLPQEEPQSLVPHGHPSDHIPLECRVDSNNAHELKRVQCMRNFLPCTSLREFPGTGESLVQEDNEKGRPLHATPADSQRISTASSSSTSSCDSLALSSSSPEPLREVTLSQDEACRRLLDLQESICRTVPRLMEFVSSHWRSREHFEKHLKEIREAAEGIACSLTCFLNFTLDIKGNARRLTDANLQTRLYKQLSIVEDSGVILQQTVGALNIAGWPLNTLCQDPERVQTPDQLERFVMVARTVPEDVKRLVSIINANGKLLFRPPQKDPELLNTTGQPEKKKSPNRREQGGDIVEDDNDYVELQTESKTDKREKEEKRNPKPNVTPVFKKPQAEIKHHSSESSSGTRGQSSSMSEHCRLYFGALQKAISGFVCSIQDGHPPEKFISHSKLVIMVGQRLVDTLCREAQREGSNQSLLCKSNHLCALLKQLAVATKKAALHYPEKQALDEAQEFAKELAQRAVHIRTSLDL
ncbi:cas scaffolding protein family member 4 [Channa argus]|uniref:cas scaffolding protein family member 4 n=1 Tax=Channa argus TaxID=215402 RepID=UPI0035228BF5